jgi:hypothetical protein
MTENGTRLTTPLGDIWVSCTGGDRVYADANSNGKPGLRVRGGVFHVTFAIQRTTPTIYKEGGWALDGDIYTSRAWTPGGKGFDAASRLQITDITKKVVPLVIQWAEGQSVGLAEAGLHTALWHYLQAVETAKEAAKKAAEAAEAEQWAKLRLDVAEERVAKTTQTEEA